MITLDASDERAAEAVDGESTGDVKGSPAGHIRLDLVIGDLAKCTTVDATAVRVVTVVCLAEIT